jgi:hypothetical protein
LCLACNTTPPDSTAPDAPVITGPINNSFDTDGSFSVSGTAEANSTVELFEGAASMGTAVADASGGWSIEVKGVSDGSHSYLAKATDAAGNTSDPSNTRTVIVDTTAPLVMRVVPGENATGIAPGTNVSASFSEAMRATSVKSAFKLYKKGSTTAITATVTYDAATKKAVLDPSANLQRGASYKAVVSAGAKDLAGNALDQNPSVTGNQQKAWFFTIKP